MIRDIDSNFDNGIKNFNLRQVFKILDSLIKNDAQIITRLAQNTGINFQRCKRYVMIMENIFDWIKTEKIENCSIIKLTETGRDFLWKLRNLFTNEI